MYSILKTIEYTDKDSNGNFFTVTEESQRLTKTIDRSGNKHPSSYPKFFKLDKTFNPKNLEELLPILEQLGTEQDRLVIRGEFIDTKLGSKVRRIGKNVLPTKSQIVAIDVDELELPKGISKTDLKAQGEYICNLLHKLYPEFFPDDMGFIAQGSSSSGFSDKVKVHLWLCNYFPVNAGQLRNLFSIINSKFKREFEINMNLVDVALYHPVQPHYTAYPLFEDTSMDPYKAQGRTVYSYGNDSYISEEFPEYVKPIKLTEYESDKFSEKMHGSKIETPPLTRALSFVRNWEASKSGLRTKVLACFHSAVQTQFCLNELRRILRPILDEMRPGMADEYFNQGIVVALQQIKALSAREIPMECKGLSLKTIDGGNHPKYLNLSDSLPDDSVTFLKATLGTGKTNTIERWLAEGKVTGKVLAITDTSALVEANAVRFAAGDFRKVDARLGFASGTIDRLSGTLHSLPKIKDFAHDFDFFFIDEADSVMNNLLFASIISEEKKQEIIDVLHVLLTQTDKVVISDGDISQETVNCYVELMDGQRKLNRVDFARENLSGVTAYKHLNEKSLWGAVEGSLEIGEKCLVVTDSSPEKLNTFYHTFTRVAPDRNVEVIHSGSKMDAAARDIVNRTNTALRERNVDLLLCSPSITNGVDFNYFDSVFVLTSTDNQTPNMRFQAMMRERQPSTIHYYFQNKTKFLTGYGSTSFDIGFTTEARREYALRREKEFQAYIATFNYYLLQSGAEVIVLDDPYHSPKTDEDKENARIDRIHAILTAGANDIILRNNDAYEQRQLLRYYYEIPATEELAWDTVGQWVDEDPHRRAEYFYSIFDIVWPYIQRANHLDIMEMIKKHGSRLYLATGESLHGGHARAKALMRRCNVEPDMPDTLETAIKYLKKYCELTPGADVPQVLREHEEDARDI